MGFDMRFSLGRESIHVPGAGVPFLVRPVGDALEPILTERALAVLTVQTVCVLIKVLKSSEEKS
jgi:hypothetical protein